MITKNDLEKLGYVFKTQMSIKDHGIDFSHPERPYYLVNLSKDEVTIIYPINDRESKPFSTKNLNDFQQWHDNYFLKNSLK